LRKKYSLSKIRKKVMLKKMVKNGRVMLKEKIMKKKEIIKVKIRTIRKKPYQKSKKTTK